MKCQHCEKPATFHITELTGPEPQELHLCEDHARDYLSNAETADSDQVSSLAGAFSQQLKLGQTAEELARLDQRACPVCGITFYEFRNQGRLGCPHDYTCFAEELAPLLANIHGDTEHTGKRPKRQNSVEKQGTELIRLRRQMKEAVDNEEYEIASKLRDRIRQLEESLQAGPEV
ncbi:MAG: UvrB/UvrC motif-containing protein [Planctomycetales bacterium]|nr:UvrB/UvrC motif-containing protein [Planctomycetales bacterium]